jgi:hypothetical protein
MWPMGLDGPVALALSLRTVRKKMPLEGLNR